MKRRIDLIAKTILYFILVLLLIRLPLWHNLDVYLMCCMFAFLAIVMFVIDPEKLGILEEE